MCITLAIKVAKIMNENYINIKVDREERPDVDKVYMTFVQVFTASSTLYLSPTKIKSANQNFINK